MVSPGAPKLDRAVTSLTGAPEAFLGSMVNSLAAPWRSSATLTRPDVVLVLFTRRVGTLPSGARKVTVQLTALTPPRVPALDRVTCTRSMPDPGTVSADQPLDGQLVNEMRIPKPASLEFDGEGLLGGDLPIIVLDFPLVNKNDSLWEMTVVPQANNTGREQPVFIRFIHVNASAAKGDARPSTLYFDSYEYNPSLGCPLGSQNPKTLAPDGCASPADFYTAILDQHFFWQRTWEAEGRMRLDLPSRPADTDGALLSAQASHGLVLDMITRSDSVWPRYGTSPGYDQPGIGADGFQEIFTATMMASLEWGMYPYASSVLDNWLTYLQPTSE